MRARRKHDFDRFLREAEQKEEAAARAFWHNVLLVKATVMVGLAASFWVPPEHSPWVAMSANLLWLWRT
jgi:hypothetical protein